MPVAKEANGILVDNKIYLIGGNNGKLLSEIDSFDLITEKWQKEGELFSGIEHPAIACDHNTIYFFENQKMCVYDLKLKQLKEYEVQLPLKYSAMFYSDNKLYIIGGRIDNDYSKTPTNKVFSIDVNEFQTTKPTKVKNLFQEAN